MQVFSGVLCTTETCHLSGKRFGSWVVGMGRLVVAVQEVWNISVAKAAGRQRSGGGTAEEDVAERRLARTSLS